MSVKQFGIYLCYAPTVDMRCEGLGRYLSAFLKGVTRDDVEFTIICPSWSKEGLIELFDSEGVPNSRFNIITPNAKPMLLRGYEALMAIKSRKKKKIGLFRHLISRAKKLPIKFFSRVENNFATAYTLLDLIKPSLELLAFLILIACISPLFIILAALFITARLLLRFVRKSCLLKPWRRRLIRLSNILIRPKDDGFVFRLYQAMVKTESERMLDLIDKMPQVIAWYSPTAFWPEFNRINTPRLMCVPDVVLNDFPINFSSVGGDRFLKNFELIQSSIRDGEHFVTYSEAVKWNTLVDTYGIRAEAVTTVHHAPNILTHNIHITGFNDVEETTLEYCQRLLSGVLKRNCNDKYKAGFNNESMGFIFYASQFRPNKNIFSLLSAYEFLLRKRFIGYKLVLTGRLETMPQIKRFILEHNLENDVFCLQGLSVKELAACYKLAILAVNPSLSEGGCPFTFTEALSVDTPVVMAKIPVTEEVLTDPELQDMTFFDPYNWRDMAARIEWAINNREKLLSKQKETYDILIQRTWSDVVNEHIAILEQISSGDTNSLDRELVV